jgi:hypothetical protein
MMDNTRALIEEELKDIVMEWVVVQDAVDAAKIDVTKTKSLFAEEKKKEEKCKGIDQEPLQAEIDSILKRHAINWATQFGGKLAGNRCWQLMAEADAIVREIGN